MSSIDPVILSLAVREHPDGTTIALRVIPRAPRTALVGRHAEALKLKVHAPPVAGAANAEARRYLARRCGVRAADVEVVAGERSRDKVVLVRGLDASAVRDALA